MSEPKLHDLMFGPEASAPGPFDGVRRAYAGAIGGMAAAMMAVTVVVTCVQVFSRYVVGSSLIWAEEVCRYMLVWTSFLVAGLAFQRGELAAMDLLKDMMPRWLKAFVLVPCYIASVAFLLMLAWYGWEYAQTNRSQAMPAADFISQSLFGTDSGLSIWWIYVSVPVGSLLLAAHFALAAVDMVVGAFRLERR